MKKVNIFKFNEYLIEKLWEHLENAVSKNQFIMQWKTLLCKNFNQKLEVIFRSVSFLLSFS